MYACPNKRFSTSRMMVPGSTLKAWQTFTNSRTSSRRSPRSYLETNDWGLLMRLARSCCVNPASLRAEASLCRNVSYSSVNIDFKTASLSQELAGIWYNPFWNIPKQVMLRWRY